MFVVYFLSGLWGYGQHCCVALLYYIPMWGFNCVLQVGLAMWRHLKIVSL